MYRGDTFANTQENYDEDDDPARYAQDNTRDGPVLNGGERRDSAAVQDSSAATGLTKTGIQ